MVTKISTVRNIDSEVSESLAGQFSFREVVNPQRFIDHYFGTSSEWIVLHDLHLKTPKSPLHIDHLLINEQLEVTILDSRYMSNGLSIEGSGKCYAYSRKQKHLIASPLTKMSRDIRAVTELIKKNKSLKRHFGIKRPVCVQGFILTNPGLRNCKPLGCEIDTSCVIAADSLFFMIWQKPAHWLNLRLKPVSAQSLSELASVLKEHCHDLSGAQRTSDRSLSYGYSQTKHCAQCRQLMDYEEIEFCSRNRDAFEQQLYCSRCRQLA